MPFRFHCEHCDVRIKVPDGSEGKKVKCPGCNFVQRVPRGAAMPAVSAVVAQPAARESTAKSSAADEPRKSKAVKPPRKPAAPVQETEHVEPATPARASRSDVAASPAASPEPLEDERPAQKPETASVKAPQVEAGKTEEPALSEHPAPERQDDSDEAFDFPDAGAPGAGSEETNEAMLAFLSEMRGDAPEAVDEKPAFEIAPPAPEDHDKPKVAHEDVKKDVVREVANANAVEPPAADDAAVSKADDVDVAAPDELSQTQRADVASDEQAENVSSAVAMPSLSSPPMETSLTQDDAAPAAATSGDEQQAPALSDEAADLASLAGESPAGEVRDLFDDFVRREAQDREMDAAQESSGQTRESDSAASAQPALSVSASSDAQASDAQARDEASAPMVGEPVVVMKVPARLLKSGIPVARSKNAQAAQAPQAPQAIPLSSATAAHARSAAVAEEVVEAQGADEAEAVPTTHAPRLTRPGNAAAAVMHAPTAQPRRLAPLPGYTTLLALCWLLRLLACVSLVSLVKLGLLWTDAGAKLLDVLIVAPLGLGVVIGIWALGEVAKATRDAVRNSCR